MHKRKVRRHVRRTRRGLMVTPIAEADAPRATQYTRNCSRLGSLVTYVEARGVVRIHTRRIALLARPPTAIVRFLEFSEQCWELTSGAVRMAEADDRVRGRRRGVAVYSIVFRLTYSHMGM